MPKRTLPPAHSSPQAQRLNNQHIVSEDVCGKCGGPLVERAVVHNGKDWQTVDYAVFCAAGCKGGGTLPRREAERLRAEAAAEFTEVANNYPSLAPPGIVLSELQRRRLREQLYGED